MKNLELTSAKVRTMKFAALQIAAAQLGIEVDPQVKKWVLLEMVVQKLAEVRHTADTAVELDEEMQTIVDAADSSKSVKMRALFDKGLTIAQITKVMGVHYSFAHGIIRTHQAKQIIAQAGEVVEEQKDVNDVNLENADIQILAQEQSPEPTEQTVTQELEVIEVPVEKKKTKAKKVRAIDKVLAE